MQALSLQQSLHHARRVQALSLQQPLPCMGEECKPFHCNSLCPAWEKSASPHVDHNLLPKLVIKLTKMSRPSSTRNKLSPNQTLTGGQACCCHVCCLLYSIHRHLPARFAQWHTMKESVFCAVAHHEEECVLRSGTQ